MKAYEITEKQMAKTSGQTAGCVDRSDLYAPQYSSLAQSVEHAAVNRRVVGSSPTRGAIRYSDTPDYIRQTKAKSIIDDGRISVKKAIRESP